MTGNEEDIGILSFCLIVFTVIFFAGYGIASINITKLISNKWVCTTSIIKDGNAVCSEYKLKDEIKDK